MSYGYDEFESKLGQFIYTMVMYERLRDYLLDKLKGKDRVSVRINLGADKQGNQVVMDVVLTAVRPQLLGEAKPEKPSRKTLLMVLSNEKVVGERRQIAAEMERLVMESLKWWHGYFGDKDRLMLNEWVAERVEVLDAPVVGTVVEVPVRRVIYQPSATAPMSEEELETLAQYVEILGPVVVRPLDNGFFELVAGHRVFDVLVNRLGYESVKALVLDVDDASASSMRAEYEEKVEKLVKTALNR
ncbi:hypothetical protein CSUB_C1069 [Candidatus Caldarchaeum subterraneum]|uniref:ParB-like N-terminal domain-containing protein n=1 Tax=Caldiarchaeum subterraneum TaxID=311458 RepID=E6N744_CALS0|nr:hypothetical protein HGMM_F30H11C03 [Candidatus Caldarchaeum subterraneum]BAJ48146.1 hypothetical protein HGMM_F21G03C04 [Candidatus Caldarchaeum subterraneum]BAJ50921.1 hypothetical protein CSUB_C1069 [Candidatus Caldarchaeum subterraneum]